MIEIEARASSEPLSRPRRLHARALGIPARRDRRRHRRLRRTSLSAPLRGALESESESVFEEEPLVICFFFCFVSSFFPPSHSLSLASAHCNHFFVPLFLLLSFFLSLKATMSDPAPAAEAAVEAGIISRERRIPLRTLPVPKRAESIDCLERRERVREH